MRFSTSSGRKTTSTQITTQPGYLCGIDANPPDSQIATLTIYDSENSDTTNKLVLAEVYLDAGFMSVSHEFPNPIHANRGIYAELTSSGSNANFIIRYSL